MKATSLLARLFHSPAQSAATAQAVSLAASLANQPDLRRWLATQIAAAPYESAALLTRASQTLRDELCDFVTASALERLAHDPHLLKAVICELRKEGNTDERQMRDALNSAAA